MVNKNKLILSANDYNIIHTLHYGFGYSISHYIINNPETAGFVKRSKSIARLKPNQIGLNFITSLIL